MRPRVISPYTAPCFKGSINSKTMNDPIPVMKRLNHPVSSVIALALGALFLMLSFHTMLTSHGHSGFVVFCLIVASVCGALGRRLYLSQWGLEANPGQGVLVKWRRSGAKREEETIPFDGLERARISTDSVKHHSRETGRTTSTTVYPVSVVDKSGKDTPIISCGDYTEARRYAEKIAKAARLDLEDTTSSPIVVRAFDKLDETLGMRLRRENVKIETVAPPEGSGLELKPTTRSTLISLPPVGLYGMVGAFVLIFLGFPFVFVVVGISGGSDTAFLVTAGPLILVAGTIIWDALLPRTMEVDDEHLLVRQVGGLRRRLGRMKLSDLEEITISASRLTCRGDGGDVVVPLKDHQSAAWVKQSLQHTLLERTATGNSA